MIMEAIIESIAKLAETPDFSPAEVKASMKQSDVNEKAFALLMNVSPMTVRMWVTGAVKPCNGSKRLMQVYGCSPDVIEALATAPRI